MNLEVGNILVYLDKALSVIKRYRIVLFVIFVVAIYGFLLVRINTLDSAQPKEDAVAKQLKTQAKPHIDENVVKHLQNLQDNSVSVQALFNQARQNPFHE